MLTQSTTFGFFKFSTGFMTLDCKTKFYLLVGFPSNLCKILCKICRQFTILLAPLICLTSQHQAPHWHTDGRTNRRTGRQTAMSCNLQKSTTTATVSTSQEPTHERGNGNDHRRVSKNCGRNWHGTINSLVVAESFFLSSDFDCKPGADSEWSDWVRNNWGCHALMLG